MFRKSKKGTQSKFRKAQKRNHHDDDDNHELAGSGLALGSGDANKDGESTNNHQTKKKFRRRSSSSSSSSPSHGEEESLSTRIGTASTSELLQQIKNETNNNKKKKTRFEKVTSKSSTENDNPFMHEYKSKNVLTQKELATLQAQHHPSSESGITSTGTTKTDNSGEPEHQKGKVHIEKETRNKFLAGPIKASKFIRTTSRFDYQPDICKDYKDTGFCGYGDTCIYLHDRTNMKTGFALEQEWEEKKRKEKEAKEREMDLFCKEIGGSGGSTTGVDGTRSIDNGAVLEEDDGIPFACHLCREAFKEPIITLCNHYFCQSCILKRIQQDKDPSCPVCNQDTNGVYNHPTKLINKRKKFVGRNGSWQDFFEKVKR